MIAVNLLPTTYLQKRTRRIRLKRWATVLVVATLISAFPVVVNVTASAHADSLQTRISPREVKLADQRASIELLHARTLRLAEDIAQSDALRAKRDWAALLVSIAQPMPDSVWLSQVSSVRRQSDRKRPDDGTGERETVILAGPSGLEIHGFALDHQPLYEFITALKAGGLFSAIELTQAGKESVLQGQAVRFVMICTW